MSAMYCTIRHVLIMENNFLLCCLISYTVRSRCYFRRMATHLRLRCINEWNAVYGIRVPSTAFCLLSGNARSSYVYCYTAIMPIYRPMSAHSVRAVTKRFTTGNYFTLSNSTSITSLTLSLTTIPPASTTLFQLRP